MKALSKPRLALVAITLFAAGGIAIKQYQHRQQARALAMPNEAVHQLRLDAKDGNARLLELATLGHPLAARLIAERTDDKNMAAHWLEKSAEAGDQKARYLLGMAYLKGDGVNEDKQKARLLFRTAGNLGIYRLGMLMLKGEGGSKDKAKGIAMVEAAAKNNDAAAIYTLGNWYRYGDYLGQDDQLAIKHYKKAANLQYVPALQELALAFEMGEMGLDINPVQAHSLSEMAGHISHCKQDHSNKVMMFD